MKNVFDSKNIQMWQKSNEKDIHKAVKTSLLKE